MEEGRTKEGEMGANGGQDECVAGGVVVVWCGLSDKRSEGESRRKKEEAEEWRETSHITKEGGRSSAALKWAQGRSESGTGTSVGLGRCGTLLELGRRTAAPLLAESGQGRQTPEIRPMAQYGRCS